jgi:type IV pilus assembly protein PilA
MVHINNQKLATMTTLNSRLKLAFLNRKQGRNLLEKGFTLVELMIVIVIVGVLSAVALPNFLGTKDKAEAGALTGSLAGLAKECANNAVLDSPDLVKAADANLTDVTFIQTVANKNCQGGAKMSNTTAFDATKIGGAKCLSDTADGNLDTFCVITISDDGDITGAWGAAVAA